MQFSFTVGTWIIPLAMTIGGLAWAMPLRSDEINQGGYFGSLSALSAVFRTGATVIVCLVIWLIWALLR